MIEPAYRYSAVLDRPVYRYATSPARPLVRALLAFRGPAHITRLVVAVIVDAVNRVLTTWGWTDISKEPLERMAPAITDGNAAFAVILKRGSMRSIASSVHAAPRRVFQRVATHAVSTTKGAGNGGSCSGLRTPTAFRFARLQGSGRCDRAPSAIATAEPVLCATSDSRRMFTRRDDHQASESLADQLVASRRVVQNKELYAGNYRW